jgi:hypothetical protein
MAHHSITEADEIALITEKRDVVADGPGTRRELGEWAGERWLTPDSVIIEPSPPEQAEAAFLYVFNRLQQKRDDVSYTQKYCWRHRGMPPEKLKG